jgi:hypothetical protein
MKANKLLCFASRESSGEPTMIDLIYLCQRQAYYMFGGVYQPPIHRTLYVIRSNLPNIRKDSAQNAFKLARSFCTQVEALKRYRSRGAQKMTVQHVHVAEGGQAIVGNVSAPAPGVEASEQTKE